MIVPKNILIVRTDRIGDVVLTLPMAEIIKRYFPESRVTFLLREYTKPLAVRNDHIDTILTYEDMFEGRSFLEKIKLLKEYDFDTVITVHPRPELALLFFMAGINQRIGSGYRWYSFLYNKRVFEHRKKTDLHELEHNVKLLRCIGIDEKPSYNTVSFGVESTDESNKYVEQLFSEKRISEEKPIIIVHPGSGGSAVDLPIERFHELLIKVHEETDAQVLLTGSESERALCETLCVAPNIINVAGLVDLQGLIAVIGRADILLANSTGPIHIAAALNVYTIGFYPKIQSCAPSRWGPYTAKKQIFVPQIKCTDCTREQCEKLQCMKSIKIEDVVTVIKEQISSFQ